MKKQFLRERECIHRDEEAPGEFYNGVLLVQALGTSENRSGDEHRQQGSVRSFWVDAPHIMVWLM